VIELTRQIRADLGRYAGNHPGIHASAGVVLVGGKYPLYQAAEDAGKAEEEAKDHQWFDAAGNQHSKDAITFLGQTMPWRQFGLQNCTDLNQQTVHAFAHKLENSMKEDKAPKALLGLLLRLQGRYDEKERERREKGADLTQERKPQALWGPWNWLSVYYIKRMKDRSDKSFRPMLDDILNLFEKQFASIQWIGLAARWAELRTRNKKETKDEKVIS
jgi:CRISPR-associated protein Csm1